jgi:Restriction endonuclease
VSQLNDAGFGTIVGRDGWDLPLSIILLRPSVPFSYEKQLRLLDSELFEELAAQLVKLEHPSARHVRGVGGDGGIDIYTGSLDGSSKEPLTVWQVKFFPDGIGKTQKRQVQKSLRRILPRRPVAWTLVVPVNLTPPALRWFEDEVRAIHPEITMTLWQGDEILRRMREASLIDLYLLSPRNELRERLILPLSTDTGRRFKKRPRRSTFRCSARISGRSTPTVSLCPARFDRQIAAMTMTTSIAGRLP